MQASRLATLAVMLLMTATPVRAQLERERDHVSLAGAVSGWHAFRLHSDTPSERPSSLLDLRLDAERSGVAHLFARVRTGYDGKIGDPDERNRPFLTLDEVYQDKDLFLEVDEAFVDVFLGDVQLRVGKQKISWGQLDEIQPTDNLNPEDLTEFYFRPELERKIGIPAATLTWYRGPWTVEGVWAPFYTAYRFPHRQDRWFPPILVVPSRVDTPFGSLPIRSRYPDVDPPPRTLASSDVALRVRRFLAGAELSASVFHGWDKSPSFLATGTATLVPTGDPMRPAAPSSDITVRPSLHRITVLGADLAVPIWLLALRAEAAWVHGRFFPVAIQNRVGNDPRLVAAVRAAAERVAASGQPETIALPILPTELERESVQYGVGIDLSVNEPLSRALTGGERLAGTFILLQLLDTVIFRHDQPFISEMIEHVVGFTIRRSFRDERVLAQVKVGYNPNHGDVYVWPEVTYRITPTLHALFEARVIAGNRSQQIGEYRDHDEIVVGLRRFF
jgi:hypothetical protein